MYRSKKEINADAMKLIAFVKRAPKAGRKYRDMVEFAARKLFQYMDYRPAEDRSLITGYMSRLKKAGIQKCADARYRYTEDVQGWGTCRSGVKAKR